VIDACTGGYDLAPDSDSQLFDGTESSFFAGRELDAIHKHLRGDEVHERC
jgi:hypothetical protein